MVNKELLSHRHDLVRSDVYKAIRAEYLDFIVREADKQKDEGVLRGMLLLIKESDSWLNDYLSALKKRNKEEEDK